MRKNEKKDNILIRRKLVLMLKKAGIRSNKDSIKSIEKKIANELRKMIEKLKEELAIQGRKTLKKEDIEKIDKEVNKENFEV